MMASLAERLLRDESAQSFVEYGLVVGLAGMAAVGALVALAARLLPRLGEILGALRP